MDDFEVMVLEKEYAVFLNNSLLFKFSMNVYDEKQIKEISTLLKSAFSLGVEHGKKEKTEEIRAILGVS